MTLLDTYTWDEFEAHGRREWFRGFRVAGLSALLGICISVLLTGCDAGIPIDDGEDGFECRTISVDQCFAVQCGYQVDPGYFDVIVNELFCPEDFAIEDCGPDAAPPVCDEPVACDEHTHPGNSEDNRNDHG